MAQRVTPAKHKFWEVALGFFALDGLKAPDRQAS